MCPPNLPRKFKSQAHGTVQLEITSIGAKVQPDGKIKSGYHLIESNQPFQGSVEESIRNVALKKNGIFQILITTNWQQRKNRISSKNIEICAYHPLDIPKGMTNCTSDLKTF